MSALKLIGLRPILVTDGNPKESAVLLQSRSAPANLPESPAFLPSLRQVYLVRLPGVQPPQACWCVWIPGYLQKFSDGGWF
ncbi:hypothetical protein HYQ46_001611 [Verticillium longisporum]|nr:hypothetical protein HYQ46_001611 [Verticillium longisporum]